MFHIDQYEGLNAKYAQGLPHTASADETAEELICGYCERTGVKLIQEVSDRAFYQPTTDSITLPLLSQFAQTVEYYSKEELIAQIGAALVNQTSLETAKSFRNIKDRH